MCAVLCALMQVQGDGASRSWGRLRSRTNMCSRFCIGGRKWYPWPSWEIIAPFVKLSSPTGHIVGHPLLVWRSSLSPVGELGRQLHHKAASITKISSCYYFISASLLANSTIRQWKKLKKDSIGWTITVTWRSSVRRIYDVCSSRSGPKKKPRAPLGQYNVGNPMERITIDVLGPLPIIIIDGSNILLGICLLPPTISQSG